MMKAKKQCFIINKCRKNEKGVGKTFKTSFMSEKLNRLLSVKLIPSMFAERRL